nr:unnamed protein product [Callosobruchus chinensis]CAH7766615.1 unnamed protein product [Callosobruchus chinensis]
MARFFWHSRGVIYIGCIEQGKTIIVKYYSQLLDRFDTVLKQIRPHLVKKKVLSHQDKAHQHTWCTDHGKKWINWATNCYLVYHNLQFWSSPTASCVSKPSR